MLREEISVLLQRELKDPRLGFVTVTGADVSPDLRHAKVFVSVMGAAEERKRSLDALNSARRFLRGAIGKRAHLRTVPELAFVEDESAEAGSRIFALLEEAREEDDWDARDAESEAEEDGQDQHGG